MSPKINTTCCKAYLVCRTCCVTVIRYAYLFYQKTDPSWDIAPMTLASMVENHTTVACAALVACRPVLAKFLPDGLISRFTVSWRSLANRSKTSRSNLAQPAFAGQERPSDENFKDDSSADTRELDYQLAELPKAKALKVARNNKPSSWLQLESQVSQAEGETDVRRFA